MKRATVYRRAAVFLVHPSSRTTSGVWILSEPCIRVSTDCADLDLGNAVRSALERSKLLVPHPQATQWKSVLEPLLRAAGVKTWKAFAKGAVCVEIEEEGDRLDMIPTANLGPDDGFESQSDKKSMSVRGSAEAVGALLREAIAFAR